MTDTPAPPGSDENPILLDVRSAAMNGLVSYDHIHSLEGVCIKRRAGDLCDLPPKHDLVVFFEKAEKMLLPKVGTSAMGMIVANGIDDGIEPDVQAAMEIGLLLLMGKPLILLCGEDTVLPTGLERAAAAIVRGKLGSDDMQERLTAAIEDVVKTL